MKSIYHLYIASCLATSPPARGAWIEMPVSGAELIVYSVAPRTGGVD